MDWQVTEGTLAESDVVILRGLPGSGKTTWARSFTQEKYWFKRVGKDDIRKMFGGEYSYNEEKFIRKIEDRIIRELLKDGFGVLVDDTNIGNNHVRRIKEACYIADKRADICLVDIMTPVEVCIQRDALREKPIGVQRILELNERLHCDRGDPLPPSPEMMQAMREALERTWRK